MKHIKSRRTNQLSFSPIAGHQPDCHDRVVDFEIIGEIVGIETIAVGAGIRNLRRLRKRYGRGHWRKCKGFAKIRLPNGEMELAEVHWYEATGICK